MISLSSSCRARGHRKQIGALGVLALASSWFNLHLARPFALLVTGCLSIIPSTPLRNLSSTQWSLFSPASSLPPLSLYLSLFCLLVGWTGQAPAHPFLLFYLFPFFFALFRAHENCEVYRKSRGGGMRRNARIAVKRWRKCVRKGEREKWDFRRWPRYREQMGFRSARMTMTLIAYFVRRHRVISGVRRRFTYYGDVTEFGACHKHAKCRCFIGNNRTSSRSWSAELTAGTRKCERVSFE